MPEQYAGCSSHARALVSSAVSGGSLEQRLRDVLGRYGQERVVLFLERRAEDFFLPSPTGSGQPLSREALRELMDRTQPSVFFFAGIMRTVFYLHEPGERGAFRAVR